MTSTASTASTASTSGSGAANPATGARAASAASAASAARVEEVATALREQAGIFNWEPQEARLLIQALRLLAEGQPISPKALRDIAGNLSLSEEAANAALDWVSERNEAGVIVGISGLSLNDWPHHFTVAGHTLSTWCALDTLFLPQMLKQTAMVETADPVTQEMVRLTIGPERVEQYTPGTAVISLRVPRVRVRRRESAEQVWNTFCHYSHFFTSSESAHRWIAEKNRETIILSVEEAYEVMRRYFAEALEYA